MIYQDRIVIDSGIRSGKPCIRGTRIAVTDIFDYLGGGMTIDEVLDDFPDLTLADIQACFAFASDRDRRLASKDFQELPMSAGIYAVRYRSLGIL